MSGKKFICFAVWPGVFSLLRSGVAFFQDIFFSGQDVLFPMNRPGEVINSVYMFYLLFGTLLGSFFSKQVFFFVRSFPLKIFVVMFLEFT